MCLVSYVLPDISYLEMYCSCCQCFREFDLNFSIKPKNSFHFKSYLLCFVCMNIIMASAFSRNSQNRHSESVQTTWQTVSDLIWTWNLVLCKTNRHILRKAMEFILSTSQTSFSFIYRERWMDHGCMITCTVGKRNKMSFIIVNEKTGWRNRNNLHQTLRYYIVSLRVNDVELEYFSL